MDIIGTTFGKNFFSKSVLVFWFYLFILIYLFLLIMLSPKNNQQKIDIRILNWDIKLETKFYNLHNFKIYNFLSIIHIYTIYVFVQWIYHFLKCNKRFKKKIIMEMREPQIWTLNVKYRFDKWQTDSNPDFTKIMSDMYFKFVYKDKLLQF